MSSSRSLCAIAHPQADICQLGMDQRKVNMLAREYCDVCQPKRKLKPVVLSHPMMPGLLQVRCSDPTPLLTADRLVAALSRSRCQCATTSAMLF